MKKISHISVGRLGEKLACKYLCEKGLRIIGRNWRCRLGELDIICVDGEQLVFVEVKSRLDSRIARDHLLDNLTYLKQRKLRILAEIFIKRNFAQSRRHRIDVIGVLIDKNNYERAEFKHFVAVV
jgi:putative endonuclease